MRITGLSEPRGSWKTMATSGPQMSRSSASPSDMMSMPLIVTSPLVKTLLFGSSRMMDRAVTLLPEPDSPTMPSALPRSSENDTLSVATSGPAGVANWVVRFRTSSTGG